MKNILTLIVLFFAVGTYRLSAQASQEVRIPLIGESAPEFKATSTMGEINFPSDYFSKWKILFSHPADFTSVCSTEILELAYLQDEFAKLNTILLVISVDGLNSHLEWVKSLESLSYKGREPVKINFPLVSDVGLEISRKYGMLHSYSSTTKDVRGVFIIDPDNKIRSISFYSLNTGRNIDEIYRNLLALQMASRNNVLTPANWKPGEDVMLPSPVSADEAAKMEKNKARDTYNLNWYMWFKKMKQD